MGRYTAPFGVNGFGELCDKDGMVPSLNDIARDLTEFYTLKAEQEKCEHKQEFHSHCGKSVDVFYEPYYSKYCPDCGKDLTKGEKT